MPRNISTSLLRSYDSWLPVACYLAVAAIISTVAVSFLKETKGIDLTSLDAAPNPIPRQTAAA